MLFSLLHRLQQQWDGRGLRRRFRRWQLRGKHLPTLDPGFCVPARATAAMTSDLDVYRSAQMLIRKHGENAALKVSAVADAMRERGNMEGVAVWRRVLKAVQEMQRKERAPGQAAH